jgi:hypothetical protein
MKERQCQRIFSREREQAMLIMIVHSSGNPIPYNVISDLTSSREIEGIHIPLPAKSNRERAEIIHSFIEKAEKNRQDTFLLVINEDLSNELNLDGKVDCMLCCYRDGNGVPTISVWKNGIGDEGISYEEFLEDLKNLPVLVQPPESPKPKYFRHAAD